MLRHFTNYNFLKNLGIYFLIFIFLNLILGCNTYKSIGKTELSVKKLTSLAQKDKYFIIHEPDSTWQLYKPMVWQSDLIGLKIELDDWYKNKKVSYTDGEVIDRKDTTLAKVVNEIHIYTESVVLIDSVRVSISIDSVHLIQFYKPQQPKNGLIVIGSVIVALGVIALIVFATSDGFGFSMSFF